MRPSIFLEFNDVLVRGEKQELFKRCFNRCYAAVNVSYEYERARILEGMGKAGSQTMTAAHHLTAVFAVGVARLVAVKPYRS